MIKPRKNKSVKSPLWGKPSIELLNDGDVEVDYVVANDRVSLFQHRDTA